jgi:flagellar biogenesis protein FliO
MDPGQLAAIIFVLALLGGLAWLVKGRATTLVRGIGISRPKDRSLELIERLPLTSSHSLYVIRARDRTLVLGIHPSGISMLVDLSTSTIPSTNGGK